MLYLNARDIEKVGIEWNHLSAIIREAVHTLKAKDYSQPIKVYLRYNELINRIIAMPAYVGGDIGVSGIKWIASFPKNIHKGLPRAHSVTVLNNAATGEPVCFINTNLISGIRTAAVSALIMQEYLRRQPAGKPLKVMITGFGPIGKLHADMVTRLLGDRLHALYLFDVKGIRAEEVDKLEKVTVCNAWQDFFGEADIFITCTVSDAPYVDLTPKPGSLHLNVSLRDYRPAFRQHVKFMLVDDWEEVCREKTDIEVMHKECGLNQSDTSSIVDVVCDDALGGMEKDDVVMFNPMGMSVFDVAVGAYYYKQALAQNLGVSLEN